MKILQHNMLVADTDYGSATSKRLAFLELETAVQRDALPPTRPGAQ